MGDIPRRRMTKSLPPMPEEPKLPSRVLVEAPRSFKFNYRTTRMTDAEAAELDIPEFLQRPLKE